jgi:hypothetical protein
MTRKRVTDEQYGRLSRRLVEVLRRVDEGTVPLAQAMDGVQVLIEDKKLAPNIIDCDANPFVPFAWRVYSHNRGGRIEYDSTKVKLRDLCGNTNGGKDLLARVAEELAANESAVNANVLDHLLAYPELIPDEWRNMEQVAFMGTVYLKWGFRLCVRSLYCRRNNLWAWRTILLTEFLFYFWPYNSPAAILVV